MSKNKENVMKPPKEQKGKNAVLIIAVGKHPKMGPGERKYKKSMKKAMNVLKRDDRATIARKRAQRKQNLLARQKKREKREANKNKLTIEKPAPKQTFDTSQLPKLIERFSLGDKNSPTKLTGRNKQELARMLGVNAVDIREGSPVLENSRAFEALKELGKRKAEERRQKRSIAVQRPKEEGPKGKYYADPLPTDEDEEAPPAPEGLSVKDVEGDKYPFPPNEEESFTPIDTSRFEGPSSGERERRAKFLERLGMARSTGDIEARAKRRKEDGDATRDGAFYMDSADEKDMRTTPSTEFTQPFGHTGKTMGGFAGGDLDKPLGFRAPVVPPKLSSPQEEAEEEEGMDFFRHDPITADELAAYASLEQISKDVSFCDCCDATELAFALVKAKKKSKPFHGYNPNKHSRKGGLNAKGRAAAKRKTGANLKPPVTTKPSKLKPGGKKAKRRKSFCARMGGVKGPTSKGGKLTPKGAALKRWNC